MQAASLNRFLLTSTALVLVVLTPAAGAAQSCRTSIPASTPTSAFALNADGTATDVASGLVWKRCAEGQTWDGAHCNGAAGTYNWRQALVQASTSNYGGFTDWRVPNVRELRSIVEARCYNPTVNATVFPNTTSPSTSTVPFWTASPYATRADYAAYVDFWGGNSDADRKTVAKQVRLVRAGQGAGSYPGTPSATAPTGCQVLINGGTAPVTLGSIGGSVDLTVFGCSPGSGLTYDWTRNGATGASTDTTWADAPYLNSMLGNNTDPTARVSTYQVKVCNGGACSTFPASPLAVTVLAASAPQPPAPVEPSLQPTLTAQGSCATDFFIGEATLASGASPGYWGMEVALTQEPRELTGGFNLGGAFDGDGYNPGFGAFSLSSPQRVTFTVNAQALTVPIGLVVDLMKDNTTRVGGVSGTPTPSVPLQFSADLGTGFYVVRISSTSSSGRGTFQLGLATTGSFAGGVVVGGYLTRAVAGGSLVGFGAFCLPKTQAVRVSLYGRSKYAGNAVGNLDLVLRDSLRNPLFTAP